eukprot:CAMPEP_0176148016 /NCGR_PEP_ID=MMETSP0120_2-20121206/75467_1 /TAXON_ID=160619 /ORGANISM="Kryptoperidinium foliaceum, Strain CCMP 1326" /LENGTH=91 /DNA_ID=CAMNT_0017484667 /DNA_START=3 /DNA_END=275 /DNA_ORIENTATION=-
MLQSVVDANAARVLYVISTDSNFYNTRMQWVFKTWASGLAEDDLIVIGDVPYTGSLFRSSVKPSSCPRHSHAGACCKYGVAFHYIYERLEQ